MKSGRRQRRLAAYFSGERNFDSSSTSPISNNPFIQNTDKIDARDIKISEVEKSHYAIAQKIKQLLMADAIPQSASGISADDVGVQLRVNSDIIIKHGSVDLLPDGERVLTAVLNLMDEYNLYLVVRGHADSAETASFFTSAWELSGARAASMVNYLVQHGVKATRMRAVSYGDTRPQAVDDVLRDDQAGGVASIVLASYAPTTLRSRPTAAARAAQRTAPVAASDPSTPTSIAFMLWLISSDRDGPWRGLGSAAGRPGLAPDGPVSAPAPHPAPAPLPRQ